MKNILVSTFMGFVCFFIFLQCNIAENPPLNKEEPPIEDQKQKIPAPLGWVYVDGDEFDDNSPKKTHWGLYGAPGIGNSVYGQGNQQMIQTYRPEQVTMHTLTTGEKVCRISSIKGNGAPAPMAPVSDKTGWWSGALSSRDANKFYPLYSRMEIRAKTPNVYGVWHAFWLRFFQGASVAELDLQEFFVKEVGLNVLSQAAHLWNNITNKTDTNVPKGQNRNFPVLDPANTFHVYGVQVDPDPAHADEAIITFLLDGKVTYSFSTNAIPGHNNFIKEAKNGHLDKAWDMAITGQIGGTWVDYPENSLTEVVTEIDWFRCFVRE